ncbi:hypothetical protein SDJN02_06314, partial [Cucurbita argyrosperma subsp. argyrosperma]
MFRAHAVIIHGYGLRLGFNMSFLLAQSMASICCCDSFINSGPSTVSGLETLVLELEGTVAIGGDTLPLISISSKEATYGAYL